MTGAARDRALPIDVGRLVESLRDEGIVEPGRAGDFAAVARLLEALFHHEFFAVKQRMRRAWNALEDGDGAAAVRSDVGREHAKDLLHALRRLLRRANFIEVPADEIQDAMRRESTFGLSIQLDLADFEHLAVWRRRIVPGRRTVTSFFGLRRRELDVELFDRFCVFARFKRGGAVEKNSKQKLGFRPGGVTLRLFRDVPRHDVEALFPGVRVRMRAFDRALIGLPAAAGVLHAVIFKIGTSVGAIVLAMLVFLGLRKDEPELRAKALGACVSLAVLFAFLFRQWMRFLGRKNLLHRQLAEHLQTCTLDAGLGVLLHVLDEAEEEETAEALLAYAFLVRAGRPVAVKELDAEVEAWLAQHLGIDVDFEEEDALAKLERLELVTRAGDGTLAAVPFAAARERLEARWAGLHAPA